MKKENYIDKIFDFVNYIVLILIGICTLFPFLVVIRNSLVIPAAIGIEMDNIFDIFKYVTLDYYKYIFRGGSPIIRALEVTIFVTIVGTFVNLLLTALTAYPLSKKYLPYRNLFMKIFFFTMIFNGGLIPTYLVVRSVGLIDSIWALIIPSALSVYYMIIMRTFFESIPEEIEESAKIDGCSDIRILFSIVLPLSLPVLASLAIFYGVGHWNSFMDAVMYINDREIWPMQLLLREILLTSNVNEQLNISPSITESVPQPSSLTAAIIIVSSLPIICIYPFLQKYFVKGIMIGAVKG
jgi:ABC-type glycerol-3-phosphate transport system permease component